MSLQSFLIKILSFLNEVIVPFIFALAFLFFLYNIARYFIIKQDEDREEARALALYGILAFVVMVSLWGIVNLLVYGTDLDRQNAPCPDYNPNCIERSVTGTEGTGSGAWDPGSESSGGRCVVGISCSMASGVRVCELCFLSEN